MMLRRPQWPTNTLWRPPLKQSNTYPMPRPPSFSKSTASITASSGLPSPLWIAYLSRMGYRAHSAWFTSAGLCAKSRSPRFVATRPFCWLSRSRWPGPSPASWTPCSAAIRPKTRCEESSWAPKKTTSPNPLVSTMIEGGPGTYLTSIDRREACDEVAVVANREVSVSPTTDWCSLTSWCASP